MSTPSDPYTLISGAFEKLAKAHDALAAAHKPPPTGWPSRATAFCERVALPLVVGAVGGMFTCKYNEREARQGEAEVARALIDDLTSDDPAHVLSAFAALEHLNQVELATAMCRAISTGKAMQATGKAEPPPAETASSRVGAPDPAIGLLGCRESVLGRYAEHLAQVEARVGPAPDADPAADARLRDEVSQIALANISAATEVQGAGPSVAPSIPPIAVDLAPAGVTPEARQRWGVVVGSDATADQAFTTLTRANARLPEIAEHAEVTTGEPGVFRKGRWYATVVTGLASKDDAKQLGLAANRRLRQGYMIVDMTSWCDGAEPDPQHVLRCD